MRPSKPQAVECIWPIKAKLGEGPFWSAAENALWFVDIFSNQIHRFDPAGGAGRSWSAPDKVSFVLPDARGRHVVGLPGAVASFDPKDGAFEILARVEQQFPKNRLNDACIDSHGRLWFGSMDEGEKANSGAIYRWGDEPAPVQIDTGYCISNGPCFSPDGRKFYATDTLDRVVYRFEVDEQGGLQGKTPFIHLEPADGYPDGTTIDVEGCLWIAFFDGWSVRRFSPDGERIGEVKLPCANVTKIAFGGDKLQTVYVTTAQHGLSPQALLEQPLAGGLFAFEADVPGLPQSLYKPRAGS